MSNKRITDLPESQTLIGTEALVTDQESSLSVTGIDTVQTTLSAIQEFTLSAAPFIDVTGDATFNGTADFTGPVTMPGAHSLTGSTGFEVTGEFSVEGFTEFFGDVDVEEGDLNVTDGFILSGGEDLGDIFAYKGQFVQNTAGVQFLYRLTQAQYDAIAVPDPTTLYIIVG
jgi:hypothetical protein